MPKTKEKLDLRVRRTRKSLHKAFLELIQEKSFTSMTVQDIAERAEINRATFYAHYADKFELHDEMLVMLFRQYLETYAVQQEPDFCEDNVRSLMFAVCDFHGQLSSNCHPIDLQYKPDIEALIQSEIYSLVHGWLQTKAGTENPDILSAAISWAIFGAGAQWARTKVHSKDEIADTIIDFIAKGLRSQGLN